MYWHRLRGHTVTPLTFEEPKRPLRWKCSCGKILVGPYPDLPPSKERLMDAVQQVHTDVITVVNDKTPSEKDWEQTK